MILSTGVNVQLSVFYATKGVILISKHVRQTV